MSLLSMRLRQGCQYIPDVRRAVVHPKFRGFPIIDGSKCDTAALKDVCPAGAIRMDPLSIDMGKCVFCGDCERACPNAIHFSNFHKLAADSREGLIVKSGATHDTFYPNAVRVRKGIKRIFGRSLKLRSVSAGGCNACELELSASMNVNFDIGRFGIDIVASPRHADGIIITGPIPEHMASALEDTMRAIPEPKMMILFGSCAISGGVFASSKALDREFIDKNPIALYVSGCPVHPLTFVNGMLDMLGRLS
ncbi:MAG: 4Fe-4S binding protein [Spirochaetota bacterium]